jgi:hypothetical protein
MSDPDLDVVRRRKIQCANDLLEFFVLVRVMPVPKNKLKENGFRGNLDGCKSEVLFSVSSEDDF